MNHFKGKELNIVPEELADKLAEKLEELFSVEIDDDSDVSFFKDFVLLFFNEI
jgi:methyl coenzyme M reductase beta subunit